MKRLLLFLYMLLCINMIYAQKECNGGDKNPPKQNNPTNIPSGDLTSQGKLSYDPNEVIGPEGYDSIRWVSINDVLNYTIMFENDPEFATAAAQKVDVRFNFQNKAWMKGFGIGNYSFSNMSFPVDKPSNAYQQRIDVKDSLSFYVDLIGGLDVARQQGFWTFTTIDPETGYAPIEAERGLLPVNDETHVGEGAVTFQLKPYEGLKTGDTISIQANIVFDQNDTIPTNKWVNTIDAGMPESKLEAELHPALPNVYNLKFTGKDDEKGSGVRHILLYMANHNGIYEEIDTCGVDSVLAFPVEAGKQYKLYSIAVDNTGNREPAKMEPDVILNFNLAPTDIALSDTIFHDDLVEGGFIGRLTSVDTEDNKAFTYALAEGEGAIHNDLFQITDDQLQIKNTFKCAEDNCYKVRISTTDEGGLSFSKPFVLKLVNVLEKPKADTLTVTICHDETCLFHGMEYDKTGIYRYSQSNDYMCDSVYVLNLTVLPHMEAPLVTVEGSHTLVSSSEKNNQWFDSEGNPIAEATEQKFTPTEDGIYYLAIKNGNCYSDLSKGYRVQVSDRIDLNMDLAKGWNWVSSNLSEESWRQPLTFLNPIIDEVERFLSQTNELYNDPSLGMVGNITAIEATEGYKILVNNSVSNMWSGNAFKPSEKPISLKKGWNWIGYVPVSENSLESALSSYVPSENDIIKNLTDFATYEGGKWIGTLTAMKPGEGYLYYSGKEANLTYPSSNVFSVSEYSAMAKAASVSPAPWIVETNNYPDNINVIANVYASESIAPEGLYTIGAFVGNACVGMGKYIDGKLFITANGNTESAQTITFKAYDNSTGLTHDVTETIPFSNTLVGSIAVPQKLTVSDQTGIKQISVSDYNIYPKPLHDRMYINGSVENIKSITMITMGGVRVIQTDGYNVNGINVSYLTPGTYVVVLSTTTGTYVDKVIKTY